MPPGTEPAPAADAEATRAPRRNPILNLFFGSTAKLEPGPMQLLMMVSLGVLFENYDIGLVNSALPQLAPDIGMKMEETGFYLGVVRLGGFGALLLVPLADRFGRRRIFLAALVGMSLGTLLTGFSQTPLQFTALQFVTRGFMLTAAALAVVILVEEFPADQRGSAVGMMSLLGGLGYGIGAGLYAAVDWLPYGWRSLYFAGVLPLFAIPFFRRQLKETRRFEVHAASRRESRDTPGLRRLVAGLGPLLELARENPRRTLAVAFAGLFGSMGSIAVFQYTSAFVQSDHGWAPGQYSLLVLLGGLIGMFGTVVGGRGSDRFGRRTVGFLGLAAAPLFAAVFFGGPSQTLMISWGLYVLCMSAGDVVVRALAAELFPTSQRGASSGVLVAIQSLGFSLGLILVGLGTRSPEELGRTVAIVALLSVVAAVSLLFLPETRRRELETISGESPA